MYSRVHAIGDSHVLHMGGLFRELHICDSQLQGATAHNLCEPYSSTDSNRKLFEYLSVLDQHADVLLLSFGEVDCRLHLRDSDMVEDTAFRYLQVVEDITKLGFRVILHAVIGAVPQDNSHRIAEPLTTEARGVIVTHFNSLLEEWCQEHRAEYLELPVSEDGVLIPSFTDDGVHLNDKATPLYRKWAEGAGLGGDCMNVVWCSGGMSHFGHVAAKALGWPLFIDIPIGDDVDTVYIVGMYDIPDYRFTLRCTARAKHRIIQWCGTDTLFADKEYLPDAYHFSAAPRYTASLIAAGITEVEPLMLPISFQPEVTPLPKIPTVSTYLGSNPAKYGADCITALMEALPDVRFQTYHLGTYTPEQMREVMENTTVQLQLGAGSGGCSLREAMQAGRTAIGALDYEHVKPFDPYDFPALIRRVRAALKRTEPDYEAAATWRELNDVDYFVSRVKGVADGQ